MISSDARALLCRHYEGVNEPGDLLRILNGLPCLDAQGFRELSKRSRKRFTQCSSTAFSS